MATINVTQELIDEHGDRVACAWDCPIFHAMAQAGLPVEAVDYEGFELADGSYYDFEAEVQQWQLDCRNFGKETARPLSFEVEIDDDQDQATFDG